MGALLLPSERFCAVRKPCAAGCQNGVLCRFWVLAGRCSRRTQKACGTAMRLCVSLSRGVAAPLGCVIFFASAEVAACTPCAQCFPNVRDEGWYHYPRRALRAAETPDGRLSKRLICRFLRSGGRSSPHDSYFLANTQNFLLAVPVANAFALWYDKFSKFEFIVLFHSYQNSFLTRTMQTAPSKWCTISSSATRTDRSVFPFLKQRVILWKIV